MGVPMKYKTSLQTLARLEHIGLDCTSLTGLLGPIGSENNMLPLGFITTYIAFSTTVSMAL
jgi:hypothetical protein